MHDTPQAQPDMLVVRLPVSDMTSIASACVSTIVLNLQTLVPSGMFLLNVHPMPCITHLPGFKADVMHTTMQRSTPVSILLQTTRCC